MTNYQVLASTKFKKDYKKYLKRKRELEAIKEVIDLLAENGHLSIPLKIKDNDRKKKKSLHRQGLYLLSFNTKTLKIMDLYS